MAKGRRCKRPSFGRDMTLDSTERDNARPPLPLRLMAWSIGGDSLSRLATLGVTLIAARIVNPLAFAHYLQLYAVAILAAVIWDAGVTTLVTREVAYKRYDARSALRRCLRLRLKTLPLWLTIQCLAFPLIRSEATRPLAVLYFALGSFCFGLSSLSLGVLRGDLRVKAAGLAAAVGRWFTVAATLFIATRYPHLGLEGLSIGFLVGEATVLLVSYSLLWIRAIGPGPTSGPSHHTLRLRNALPFAANTLLSTLYNRFDIVIVGILTSSIELARYAPASRIQDALYLVPSSLGLLALPMLSTLVGTNRLREARRLVGVFLISGVGLCLPMALLVFVFAPHVLRQVFGAHYLGAVGPTRLIVWSLPAAALGAPLLAYLSAHDRAVDTTKAFAIAFAVALASHLLLDRPFGAMGAAFSGMIRDVANLITGASYARSAALITYPLARDPNLP